MSMQALLNSLDGKPIDSYTNKKMLFLGITISDSGPSFWVCFEPAAFAAAQLKGFNLEKLNLVSLYKDALAELFSKFKSHILGSKQDLKWYYTEKIVEYSSFPVNDIDRIFYESIANNWDMIIACIWNGKKQE